MKKYESKDALCPFYLHEGSQVIYCEGVEEGCVCHLAFANADQATDYKTARCKRDWKRCKIAKMLGELYG